MYPGFIAEYEDRSAIQQLAIQEVRNMPLFCAVFTSDKGTEAWTRISGKDFFNMYSNNISFARHGQPLLQAAMAINSGAELLCKRLVADDATLANMGIVATITEEEVEVQGTDAAGNLLYLDAEGAQTTEKTDTPHMVSKTQSKVTYSIRSASEAKTLEEAATTISGACAEGERLLFVLADNGRGVSKKRIKIVPNYKVSKGLGYTQYTLTVLEGDVEVESMAFSIDPTKIVNGENISLGSRINTKSTQLKAVEFIDNMDAYVADLAAMADITPEEMYAQDVLFGCTARGEALAGITIDTSAIDLKYEYGNAMEGGSNGAFGNYPFAATAEYSKQAINAFNGTFDTVIFNMDQYKIDAIIDANYPADVKRAIEALAMFREDFMYFRDQGLKVTSLPMIEEGCKLESKTRFAATYPQSYDIIDPYTKRQITVTIGYDMAQKLVQHMNNGRSLPTAGFKYQMTIDNAIYGTLSFSPVVCPEINQKEILEDLHVNYASYIDNRLVIEALYTSQEEHSQWSYVNNVLGIQEVVKAVRTRCPAIRYTFIDGDDLEAYKADVEEVISAYRSNFKTLELEYVQDTTYAINKIFYAVLKVAYKDFIQTEMVKVVALSTAEIEV